MELDINKPVKADPFDMAAVKNRLAEADALINDMVAIAGEVTINSDDDNRVAVAMAGQAKTLFKRIESTRKDIVDEPNTFVRGVNSFCKGYQQRLEGVESGLKGKIQVWMSAQELERRKRERKAQEEARALQARLDAEAKEAEVEAPVVVAPVEPPPEKAVRTEAGAAHVRKTWKFEVVDPAVVPAEYLTVDEKKIRQAVAAGCRTIVGVRIFEDSSITLRT